MIINIQNRFCKICASWKEVYVKQKKNNKKCKNRCEICSVIYESLEDKNLRKKFKGRQNQWVAYDTESCDYWVHARCINMKMYGKTKDIVFRCPDHKEKV